MLHPTIKQIAKKITTKGKGLFIITYLSNKQISFKGCNNVFSFQLEDNNRSIFGIGTFAAGHVITDKEYKPTYESEYQFCGYVETSKFIPYHIAETDNPDYILRNSIHFILNN
jgi:hypothetical protein